MRYDIAIIGTGPAGLSAAITAKIRNKSILLLGDKNLSGKIVKAHSIQNYLGIPAVGGQELGTAFETHLNDMNIEITEDKINAVYAMGEYFSLQGNGTDYQADTIILATGANFGKPFKGEMEFLGRGVSYCATCDAPLYKGKDVVIIGYSSKEEAEVDFMVEVCNKVYYIPMYKDEVHVSDDVEILTEIPVAIEGTIKAEKLVTKSGNSIAADGIFILRESVAPSQLVPGLVVEDNHVLVNRKMETNLAGCFACGDIVGAPYQYIKSAGEGNVAALSAVAYIDAKKRMI